MNGLEYFCDEDRHLVCVPYSVENLHEMARDLRIKRCWFHSSARFPHYDIPKRRIAEITARCTLVSSRDILRIVKGTYSRESAHQPAPEVLDGGQKNPEAHDHGVWGQVQGSVPAPSGEGRDDEGRRRQ